MYVSKMPEVAKKTKKQKKSPHLTPNLYIGSRYVRKGETKEQP